MGADPWLTEFRALHERAKKGGLNAEEQNVYLAAREQLARTLAKVQGLSLKPGDTARQHFRVAVVLMVELSLPEGPLRIVTLDIGRGGFSSMLQKVPVLKEPIGVMIKLPGGGEPLTCRAKIVDNKKQVGNFRVSFAFVDLGEAAADRIERGLFDSVLARLGV